MGSHEEVGSKQKAPPGRSAGCLLPRGCQGRTGQMLRITGLQSRRIARRLYWRRVIPILAFLIALALMVRGASAAGSGAWTVVRQRGQSQGQPAVSGHPAP